MDRSRQKNCIHCTFLSENTKTREKYLSRVIILKYVVQRTFHHYGKISLAWWGGGGGCARTPFPFHSIYHHEQSCGVRSSSGGRCTPPISSIPICTLCTTPSARKRLGGRHTRFRGEGVGGPNSDEGPDTLVLYV
jgi:hypothetical protein